MLAFFAALAAFFAFGTFGFWLLAVLAFIIITAFEENEWEISAIISLAVFAAIVGVLKSSVLAIIHHPVYAILGVLAYLAIGTLWGVIKWTFFVRRMLERFNEAKADFLAVRNRQRENNVSQVVGDDDFKHTLYVNNIEFNPQVKNHKEDIMRWMTFWPFSFVWTMLSDPLTKAFRHIYYSIQGALQKISDKMFAKANMSLSPAEIEDERPGVIRPLIPRKSYRDEDAGGRP